MIEMKVKRQVEQACQQYNEEFEYDEDSGDEHELFEVVRFGFGIELSLQSHPGYHVSCYVNYLNPIIIKCHL